MYPRRTIEQILANTEAIQVPYSAPVVDLASDNISLEVDDYISFSSSIHPTRDPNKHYEGTDIDSSIDNRCLTPPVNGKRRFDSENDDASAFPNPPRKRGSKVNKK
ncbi:hypothetical protein RIF29_26257 [Crotalaria pallida]|uniref:Uncharacterized protein n=1 Tax=Crotalaria pallida TaxID=3830 RepID=A0AAN9EMG4_CROPI